MGKKWKFYGKIEKISGGPDRNKAVIKRYDYDSDKGWICT